MSRYLRCRCVDGSCVLCDDLGRVPVVDCAHCGDAVPLADVDAHAARHARPCTGHDEDARGGACRP